MTPLGSEKQGEKSLKALVEEQSEEEETETWDVKHLPLNPPPCCPRLPCAYQPDAGVLLAQLFQLIAQNRSRLCGCLVGAAAAALWTPLGSALVIACAVYTGQVLDPTSTSFPLQLVTLLSVITVTFAGRSLKFSSINFASWAPCCCSVFSSSSSFCNNEASFCNF